VTSNPQFDAIREVIDAIVGPGKPVTGDIHAVQRRLLAAKLDELDELRTRYDALSTNHLKAVEALKIVNNALRRLCELNQFGIPGMGELREALSDLLDELA
jgi:hypothetical protein